MKRFEWIEAANLDAALAATAGGAVPKAGGMDLLDLMKEGLLAPRRVVNIRALGQLRGITEESAGTVRIGAGMTLAEIASHPLVARYPALAQAAARSASPQIRNVATLAGNLLQRPRCWYFRSAHHHCARKGGAACFAFTGENQYHAIFGHDGCAIVHPSTPATALVALGATLEIAGAKGRRMLALEDFFVLPERDILHENVLAEGEIVTAIVLPRQEARSRSVHLRQGQMDSFDWPIADVAVAVVLDPDGTCRRASIVLGSAAPTPWRASRAEAALAGKRIDEETARIAARAALEGAQPLSHNAYKVPVLETLVHRALLEAAQGA